MILKQRDKADFILQNDLKIIRIALKRPVPLNKGRIIQSLGNVESNLSDDAVDKRQVTAVALRSLKQLTDGRSVTVPLT